jgi:hypothetical protein
MEIIYRTEAPQKYYDWGFIFIRSGQNCNTNPLKIFLRELSLLKPTEKIDAVLRQPRETRYQSLNPVRKRKIGGEV